ncbi:unnamed protein product [Xylocopa violacea]|uniref:G-protein coupled receptors family 2 profile 2 domain-containing protein n=1 Tax=Xylocopa violacea TaxID=135666 RepID=A0ABP1NY86_XYLVO
MITKCIVVLSALSLSAGVSGTFNKCCPIGEVFSGVSKVNCVPTPRGAAEIYIVDFSNKSVTYGEIPACEKPEDITTMPLFDISPNDFLQEPSCIEILHEQAIHQSVPIFVYCKSNEDRNTKYAVETSVPQLLSVRRCCSNNTVFNVTAARCQSVLDVFDEDYSERDDFLSLMPREMDHLDFLTVLRGPPRCTGPIVTYEIDEGDIVFANGVLQAKVPFGDTTENLILTERNTCLDLTPDSRSKRRLAVRVCRDDEYCSNHKCIRTCCYDEEDNEGFPCGVIHRDSPRTTFHDVVVDLIAPRSLNDYGILYGMKCRPFYSALRHEIKGLTPEGNLYLDINVKSVSHERYCIDVDNRNTSEGFIAFICFGSKKYEPAVSFTRIVLTTVLSSISCLFLVLTLLVYACLPTLRNLHGKTLMCHSASLLMAYASLATIPWLTPDESNYDATNFCSTLGYIMLFSFLSAFCWLNVMCFDIWRTFGRLQGNLSRSRGHAKKFFFYCLYACGLSMFIATCAILTDKMHILPDYLRPDFGNHSCWFDDIPGKHGELVFFRGPIAVQLTLNVVFFILTAEQCNKVKAEISRVADPMDPRSRRFQADKTKFIMNVKLFIVMGISWVTELISSFVNKYTDMKYREEVFYASDIVNCLQGVMIFVLFVMKPRVHQALKARLGLTSGSNGSSHGTSMLQDPYKVKKSASNTLRFIMDTVHWQRRCNRGMGNSCWSKTATS